MKIDMVVLKSKIDEIYEDKKNGDGWAAWSALCLWLAQYEYAQQSVHPTASGESGDEHLAEYNQIREQAGLPNRKVKNV